MTAASSGDPRSATGGARPAAGSGSEGNAGLRAAASCAGSPEVACVHCGLPVPLGRVAPVPARSFCCDGCETAWSVIRAAGLEGYYRLPERRGEAVRASGRGFEEFDHPAFATAHVRGLVGGRAEVDLYLRGVHCASCVWLVERLPWLVPGVERAELDAGRGLVRVTWDPRRVPLSAVARGLDTLGYRPHPLRGRRGEEQRRAEDRAAIARLGVAGALAGNSMLVALAIYSGWFGHMDAGDLRYFRWLSLLLATPALLWPGRVFFRGAWGSLRARRLHMDVPIALALGAAWARGAVNTVTGQGPIYFDGVAMLVFLLLAGRFLQQRAQRAAADSAELMVALAPSSARVVDGGRVRELPVEALLPGMVCEVRGGDGIPADGRVVTGTSALDLSWLTGEWRPRDVSPGDEVFAGTVNRGATLTVVIDRTGTDTRLGRILRELEAGAQRRAPVVRAADRLAGAFTGVVLALASVTVAMWWGRDASAAVDHAIALLVVTCPCALALATPLAVTVAIGRAARRGILVRGGEALESLARPGRLLLDKTGTVTEGRPRLERWVGADHVRPWVLGLERHATHPLAVGFLEAWPGVTGADARDVRAIPGGGLEGTVGGRRIVVGAPALVRSRLGIGAARVASPAERAALHHAAAPAGAARAVPPRPVRTATEAAAGVAWAGGDAVPAIDVAQGGSDEALTPVWVAVDGVLAARAWFGDPIRPDAGEAVSRLRAAGWRVEMLSGDAPEVVASVASRLGFGPAEWRAGVSPEQKLAAVEEAARAGTVVMVGDGVNDAAAIASATVGIGVRGGAEAALSVADAFVAAPGLAPVAELVEGARRTLGIIRRGFAFSLAYNLVGASLAMAGWINPLTAAIVMPVSSLTVVMAAWWGRTFGEVRG